MYHAGMHAHTPLHVNIGSGLAKSGRNPCGSKRRGVYPQADRHLRDFRIKNKVLKCAYLPMALLSQRLKRQAYLWISGAKLRAARV